MEKPLQSPPGNDAPPEDEAGRAEKQRWHATSLNDHGMLDVGNGHRIYWEEAGSPDGIPAIFVHGGPGAGSAPLYRGFFDPRRYRAILFDQRGAGRSEPYASAEHNTTQHLIEDMERLRRHLKVSRWLVFGGSWGSTLSLAYGQAHPERCLGFILRGVFLFRRAEVEWFLHGMGRFFPEAEDWFKTYIPAEERGDLLAAYARRVLSDDPAVHGPAARIWARYEDLCCRLLPRGRVPVEAQEVLAAAGAGQSLPMARLEVHYMMNGGFLEEGQLLAGIGRIAHLPCTIVQGRYDIVCPPRSAHDLHRAWPGSRLIMVPDAGHSALEPAIQRALVDACDDFADATGAPV